MKIKKILKARMSILLIGLITLITLTACGNGKITFEKNPVSIGYKKTAFIKGNFTGKQGETTTVKVNGKEYETYVAIDGSFVIDDYVLENEKCSEDAVVEIITNNQTTKATVTVKPYDPNE